MNKQNSNRNKTIFILKQLIKKPNKLDKYLFLAWLRKDRFALFSQLILAKPKNLLPLIYTPTIGEVCLNYSVLAPILPHEGLIIPWNNLSLSEDQLLLNYKDEFGEPQIAILTDGSRVLGLGDLGINGFPICSGKAKLYNVFAGIAPSKTLPIILDWGTNNSKNFQDACYSGLKQRRPIEKDFYQAMDNLMESFQKIFPKMLIHFEDFQTDHALKMLERYQEKYYCFNDDIQGTGAVVLAGLINATKQASLSFLNQRILLVGAGSASIGVADLLLKHFQTEYNISLEEAKKKIWLVDSKGLVTKNRGDELSKQKKNLAHKNNDSLHYQTLSEIIDFVQPTTLVGLSGQGGIFTANILKLMAHYNQRPIIFALSNPQNNSECSFAEAMKNTNNQAIFASGTDFPDYFISTMKKKKKNNQANNMYIFPGLGLGASIIQGKKITNFMIYAAAKELANCLNKKEKNKDYLYPELSRIREISANIAAAVIQQAWRENLITKKNQEIYRLCKNNEWHQIFAHAKNQMK